MVDLQASYVHSGVVLDVCSLGTCDYSGGCLIFVSLLHNILSGLKQNDVLDWQLWLCLDFRWKNVANLAQR